MSRTPTTGTHQSAKPYADRLADEEAYLRPNDIANKGPDPYAYSETYKVSYSSPHPHPLRGPYNDTY